MVLTEYCWSGTVLLCSAAITLQCATLSCQSQQQWASVLRLQTTCSEAPIFAFVNFHCDVKRKLSHSVLTVALAMSQEPACMSQHFKPACNNMDGVRISGAPFSYSSASSGAPMTPCMLRHTLPKHQTQRPSLVSTPQSG